MWKHMDLSNHFLFRWLLNEPTTAASHWYSSISLLPHSHPLGPSQTGSGRGQSVCDWWAWFFETPNRQDCQFALSHIYEIGCECRCDYQRRKWCIRTKTSLNEFRDGETGKIGLMKKRPHPHRIENLVIIESVSNSSLRIFHGKEGKSHSSECPAEVEECRYSRTWREKKRWILMIRRWNKKSEIVNEYAMHARTPSA